MTNDVVLWKASDSVVLKHSATLEEVASRAQQLPERDKRQILKGLENESYEMVSTFVWQKAITALRKQLADLGMDFVGEMLGRPDIVDGVPIEQKVTEYETLRLAQDLGMINSTEAMRLRHSLEVMAHFFQKDEADDEGMSRAEAENCLRACVQAVLGRAHVDVAVKFAEFRNALETRDFQPADSEMTALQTAPYFFQKTTLAVLLALIKNSEGAQLEHSLANTRTVLPLIWDTLRKPEKFQTGSTYAELHSAGRIKAATGLKRALLRVKGFDFVPENLRSLAFVNAANKIFEAHEGWDNYTNEVIPMRTLSNLGTAIPMPALHSCVSAALCVYLGNAYGNSRSAAPLAKTLLETIRDEQWAYYLKEALPSDRRILEKMSFPGPRTRWMDLAKEFNWPIANLSLGKKVSQFLNASVSGNAETCTAVADSMLYSATGR